jgi:hypothetical protein
VVYRLWGAGEEGAICAMFKWPGLKQILLELKASQAGWLHD